MAELTPADGYEAPAIEARTDIGPALIGVPVSSNIDSSAAFYSI